MRRIFLSLVVLGGSALISNPAVALTLGQALDNTNLTWTTSGTGGASGWSAETTVSHDGDAAQSAVVFNGETSTLQTIVTGPGTLSFWWYAPDGYGTLAITVGGITQATYNWTNWQEQTVYIGSGSQTVQWVYSVPASVLTYYPGYLDEVSWVTGATAPIITNEPASQSQVQGLNNSFAVTAVGTPPLSYQWYFNDVDIPGATNSSLIVTNVQSTNLGHYSVTITNVAGSTNSTEASLEFGNITAWGFFVFSQTYVPPGATNVLGIATGWEHSLAVKSDGSVLAWGRNSAGEELVPANLPPVIAVDANQIDSLALETNGAIVEWGDNSYGQTNTATLLTNVVALAAADSAGHALAVHSDGTVTAWGFNGDGQTNVPPGLSNVVAVAAGGVHSLALTSQGNVIAWGASFTPGVTNVPPDLTNAVAVAAGQSHSLALRSDGTVTAWGNTFPGVTNVPAGLTNVVAIQAGAFHCIVLRADGTVVAWGLDNDGQTNVPVGLSNVVAIAAGQYHNVALVGNGPPIMSAVIQNPVLSANGFSFCVPSQSGRVYALEYKNSLTDPSWTALPLFAGNGTNLTLIDPTATNSPQRFYRVRRW